MIHQLAKDRGFISQSQGAGNARFIAVFKKQAATEARDLAKQSVEGPCLTESMQKVLPVPLKPADFDLEEPEVVSQNLPVRIHCAF